MQKNFPLIFPDIGPRRFGTRTLLSHPPEFVITVVSSASNVLTVSISSTKNVVGFTVGDITISAGGSLANFAGSGKSYTVDWTLAAGANTMDIAAGVCTDEAGNGNLAATQYNAGYLTLQPDGSVTDIDTPIRATDTANYATATNIWLGYLAGSVRRLLIKFDLSGIPTAATIGSAIFTLNQEGENSGNARRISFFKVLRDWVVTQASANGYATGHAWQTAFCEGALDRELTEFFGRNVTATEANGAKAFTVPATTKNDFGAYGWIGILSDETADAYLLTTSNGATAGNRPKLVVVYYVNP